LLKFATFAPVRR